MKIIDLSIPIEDGLPSDPPIQIPKIQYCNHKDTAEQMAGFFKGCTVEDLPEGNGWGIEFLQVCTHSGTHVDAPYHYYPTMNGGERAWTIDEVPLDWFVGDGVVMDFHDKPMDTRSPPRMWRSTSRRSTTPSSPAILSSCAPTPMTAGASLSTWLRARA